MANVLRFSYVTEQTYKKSKPQVFCSVKNQYRLNEATNLLEEDGTVDIDEMIASVLPTQLDKILEAYLPEPDKVNMDGIIVDRQGLQSNIDFMQASFLRAEDLKKKYGLRDDMSINDVFNAVQKMKFRFDEEIKKREEEEKIREKQDNSGITDNSRGTDGSNTAFDEKNKEDKEVKGGTK